MLSDAWFVEMILVYCIENKSRSQFVAILKAQMDTKEKGGGNGKFL